MLVEKLIRRPWHNSKPSGFRASEAGMLCARYQYHARVDWEARPTVSEKVQDTFSLGVELERWVVRRLEEAGIQVIRSQQTLYDPQMEVVGAIDGMVEVDGEGIAIEIKSVQAHFWERVNTYADILQAGRWYVRWAVQLPLYLYLHELKKGLYLFINKSTGELKEVSVNLDEALPLLYVVDDILKDARAAIKDGKPPEPRPLAPDGKTPCPELCGDCWAHQVGLCPGMAPEFVPAELDLVALAEAAEEAQQLKTASKQYDAAMGRVKRLLENVQLETGRKLELLAGTAVVRVTQYDSTAYDIPKEVKEQYKVIRPARRVEVV